MSDANVELARRGLEAFNRGDIEAVLAMLAPDVAVKSSPDLANPGDFHGHDGFLTWMRDWMDAWERFRVEARDAVTVGDAVVLSVHQVASGRGSGVEVEMDVAYLFAFAGGKVARLELHAGMEDALAAARR